jgi:hypothetical protein
MVWQLALPQLEMLLNATGIGHRNDGHHSFGIFESAGS